MMKRNMGKVRGWSQLLLAHEIERGDAAAN
jgi:hypothetical protein